MKRGNKSLAIMEHLLRYKAVRDACQAELCKTTKFLEKWQTVSEKNLSQEEHTMRLQLERLQKDKAKFSLEAGANEEYDRKRRFSESDSHSDHFRRHSFSSNWPKLSEKRSFHSNEVLQSSPRSHRQLKLESSAQADASQHSIREVPKNSSGQVTKLPKIQKEGDKHRDRRKSMPADSVYGGNERRHHGDKRKKKQHPVPLIVLTGCSGSPEPDGILSIDDQNEQQFEPLATKLSDEKTDDLLDRRRSQHDQQRHDAKASSHHLDRLQHEGSTKSVDSVARGSHHNTDHDKHDTRGSHQHMNHDKYGTRGSHQHIDHDKHDSRGSHQHMNHDKHDTRGSHQHMHHDKHDTRGSHQHMHHDKHDTRGSHQHMHHDKHDTRGSHHHLDHLHHTGVRKNSDSPSRGSHQHMDHHDHEDTEELTCLYDMAIQTVASANESAFTQVQDVHKRAMPNWKDDTKFPDAKQMDLSSLQELETLLKDARQYNTRKQKESDYGLHTAENRQQRRRLQFLEEILQALSDNHGANFDPMEMLQCGYLRLSKSNIERLEHMVREMGIDPGIHAHSDVAEHDIWSELRELRKQEALEREQLQKEASGRRHSRHSARRGRSDVKQSS